MNTAFYEFTKKHKEQITIETRRGLRAACGALNKVFSESEYFYSEKEILAFLVLYYKYKKRGPSIECVDGFSDVVERISGRLVRKRINGDVEKFFSKKLEEENSTLKDDKYNLELKAKGLEDILERKNNELSECKRKMTPTTKKKNNRLASFAKKIYKKLTF